MIEAVLFRSQARGCIRTAIPLAIAALSLFLLLVSTDISQACANAEKAAAHAKITIAVVQAPYEIVMPQFSAGNTYVASVAVASVREILPAGCCDTPFSQCGGNACSKGCCAACAPAALASSDEFTLIECSRVDVDRQGSTVFYRISSSAFRPPRTIA